MNSRSPMQGNPAMTAAASAAAFNPGLPNPLFSTRMSDMGLYSSVIAQPKGSHQAHFQAQIPSKEKQWIIRYEELKLFQEV